MVSKRSRCHDDGDGDDGDGDDGDGDDGDDGVRGLCQERLRQLRWARALKISYSNLNSFASHAPSVE